jgi:hypothetical protein
MRRKTARLFGSRRSTRRLYVSFILSLLSGSSSAVERQLPKLDVAGSIPVSRSIVPPAYLAALNTRQCNCIVSARCDRK